MISAGFKRFFTMFLLQVFALTSLGFTSVVEVCCPPEFSNSGRRDAPANYCVSCLDERARDTHSVSSIIRCHKKEVVGGRFDVRVIERRGGLLASQRTMEVLSVSPNWDEDLDRTPRLLAILFELSPRQSHPRTFLLNSSLLL